MANENLHRAKEAKNDEFYQIKQSTMSIGYDIT